MTRHASKCHGVNFDATIPVPETAGEGTAVSGDKVQLSQALIVFRPPSLLSNHGLHSTYWRPVSNVSGTVSGLVCRTSARATYRPDRAAVLTWFGVLLIVFVPLRTRYALPSV